jgi:hypothetical protein
MAVQDNRPQIDQVLRRLAALPASLLTPFAVVQGDVTTYPTIEEMLDDSISWIEDQATTSFNCRYLPVTQEGVALNPAPQGTQGEGQEILERGFKLPPGQGFFEGEEVGYEAHDGNTTNQITTRKRPICHIAALQVVTPILGYTRVYTAEEIKNYVKEGVVKVWTYKLAVEQALLQTIDYQAWGSLFPPLPQAVQIAYAYGYPLFDPECTVLKGPKGEALAEGPATSYDGGRTWHAGDIRDPEQLNWLRNLQQAVVCNAAAEFLGQCAGLGRGFVTSVSFDGYSRGMASNPFQSEIEALLGRRDELMGRRKRRFVMGTIG